MGSIGTSITLPGFGTLIFSTAGGNATGQAGFAGGNGGAIDITTSAARIMEDDNRSKPTVGTDVLTGYAGTITYADLQTIDGANGNVTIVEDTVTFTPP